VGVNVWEALRDVADVHAAWAHRLGEGKAFPRKNLRRRRGLAGSALQALLTALALALLLVALLAAVRPDCLAGVAGQLPGLGEVRQAAVAGGRALQGAAQEAAASGLELVATGAARLRESLRAQELGLKGCTAELLVVS
jgi:putative NIF3 family GTP cyclohydrolase 1 type 2